MPNLGNAVNEAGRKEKGWAFPTVLITVSLPAERCFNLGKTPGIARIIGVLLLLFNPI